MTWLQNAIPILALLWLAMLPLPGLWGGLQMAAASLLIAATGLSFPWLAPSAYLPWGYAALLPLAVLLRRRRFHSRWPHKAAVLVALLLGATIAGYALSGRIVPSGRVLDLASPLAPGRYLVVNGGGNALINAHYMTLDQSVERFAAWRGQSYALDLVELDRFGQRRKSGAVSDPASYLIYGNAVLAPCDGQVVSARNDVPDMMVPQMDRARMLGNFVVLSCGDAWVVLAHLRPGSLKVAAGQTVSTGQHLGEVGNTGNTSEPHLHIHVQMPGTEDQPIGGKPVFITLDGRFLARGQVYAP